MASLAPNKKVEPSYKKTAGNPIWILTLNQIMYVHNKRPQIDLVSQTNALTQKCLNSSTISTCIDIYIYKYRIINKQRCVQM